jgi:hypothetical protein
MNLSDIINSRKVNNITLVQESFISTTIRLEVTAAYSQGHIITFSNSSDTLRFEEIDVVDFQVKGNLITVEFVEPTVKVIIELT